MKKPIERLEDLKPDPKNANRGTPRGHGIIEQSISRHGAGRSGLAAKDGTMIAGSQTLEEMIAAGIKLKPVHTKGDEWVVVIRDDVEPGSEQAALMGLEDNRSTLVGVDFDPAILAELGETLDLSGLFNSQELAALLEQAGSELLESPSNQIVGHSQGYDFRDIHAGKLAYRVEAAWRGCGGLAIDLYSGQGQLAEWYGRRFDQVIRIDQDANEGIDFVGSAADYLKSADFAALVTHFDFIDFDDEGSPLREVRRLFEVLPVRQRSFVLCITDGSGLNLKLHGRFDPSLYGLKGAQRRATTEDYEQLDVLVQGAINAFAALGGYTAQQWSSVRGSEGNVVYQTYLISRSEEG